MTVFVLVATSCGAGPRSAADSRAIALYSDAIQAVANEPPVTTPRGPIFVESANAIPLAVQAGVIDLLDSFATVRFIDERTEAVDDSDPNKVVRESGILLTLGELPPGSLDVTVKVDRYDRLGAGATYTIKLHQDAGGWKTIGAPARA